MLFIRWKAGSRVAGLDFSCLSFLSFVLDDDLLHPQWRCFRAGIRELIKNHRHFNGDWRMWPTKTDYLFYVAHALNRPSVSCVRHRLFEIKYGGCFAFLHILSCLFLLPSRGSEVCGGWPAGFILDYDFIERRRRTRNHKNGTWNSVPCTNRSTGPCGRSRRPSAARSAGYQKGILFYSFWTLCERLCGNICFLSRSEERPVPFFLVTVTTIHSRLTHRIAWHFHDIPAMSPCEAWKRSNKPLITGRFAVGADFQRPTARCLLILHLQKLVKPGSPQ